MSLVENKCRHQRLLPQGRDILAVVEAASKTVGQQLLVFSNIIGARRYNARVFTFEHEKRGKKNPWQLADVQPADPQFIAGGADNLRSLMNGSMAQVEGRAISVWVHALSIGNEQRYLAFIRHEDGMEAIFVVDGKSWGAMGLAGASLEMTLHMMLSRGSRHEGRWNAMVTAEKEVMRDGLREDMENFLTSVSASGLTDEKWEEFLTLVFDRRQHRMLLQEVARSCGSGLVHESQRLLESMVDLVDTALENHSEKLANMDKAHTRALKRFQTDVLKFKSGRDIAVNRLKVVEKELLGLKKQVREIGAGHQPQSGEGAIGTALDRFFV